jgi:nucleotide-binding universal stress UspA family protein|uniref:Universal stress protein n=1 Tax=Desulfobacca acetoxidans TaxID=60893 RepID=A0A7C3UZ76_9BACT
MAKYRKLLVAVDGSASSLHALEESFRLTKVGIVVVAVAPPFTVDLKIGGQGEILKLLKEPCESALTKAAAMAKEANAEIVEICAMGQPHERIVDLSEKEGCDLIVMGAKGMLDLDKTLMGDTTAKVIGYSLKDVLVVPENTTLGFGKILVATDGSEYSRRAMARAMDFAESYGSELDVVSVVEIPAEIYSIAPQVVEQKVEKTEEYVAGIKKQAESRGIKTRGFVQDSEAPYAVITERARKEGNGLIILGSHGRTGIKRILMGSTAERVIAHAPCPVLVVKTC